MIKESGRDFTCGNVKTKLINFAIPIMLGNMLMQLYQYIDSVIVGQYLGKEALAAVGASTPITFMLVSLVIGISIGSTILIGQYYGNNDFISVRKATDSLYLFLISTAIILTVLGLIFNEEVMLLLGLPSDVLPHAVRYLDISLIGFVFLFLFNGISAILRGVGDAKTPLISLLVSAVINLLLDLLFVIWCGFGIEGAAWATVISQFITVVFAFVYTGKRNKLINTNLIKIKFDSQIFMRGVKLGIPAGIQQLFVAIGMLTIMGVVAPFDTNIIAGYSAALRIESFVSVIPITLSMALTSFISQNYGAKLKDRMVTGLNTALKISVAAGILIMVGLSAFALPLMKMFSDDVDVINAGTLYLYVLAPSYIIFSVMFCFMGVLRGIGNTVESMIISIIALCLVRVPVAYLLSQQIGEIGIWLSATLSWSIGASLGFYFYRKHVLLTEISKHD